MADDRSEAGVLGRWSRLKQEDRRRSEEPAEGEPAAEAGADQVAGDADAAAGADQAAGDAHAAAPPELPDIDSLGKDSDYTGFMAADVPEELQRAALRRLWRSDPVLANLDGLNDYDEDFSAIGIVAQTVTSLYEAGKGYPVDEEDAEDAGDAEAGDGNEVADAETADASDDPEPAETRAASISDEKTKPRGKG